MSSEGAGRRAGDGTDDGVGEGTGVGVIDSGGVGLGLGGAEVCLWAEIVWCTGSIERLARGFPTGVPEAETEVSTALIIQKGPVIGLTDEKTHGKTASYCSCLGIVDCR